MSLEATKQRLSRKYLGQAGIHGIGVSKRHNAVRVHSAPAGDPAQKAVQDAVLDALRRDASPYAVLIVTEDRATASVPMPAGGSD